MYTILAAALLLVSGVQSAPSVPVPGNCPSVTTTQIANFTALMGLWWRPYRSQFNAEEPLYKCLSTGWFDLIESNKTFGVVDYNFDLVTGEAITLIGEIYAVPEDDGDWRISFTTGFSVNAQILDLIEDTYIYMYVCEEGEDGNSHTQNGIIFTRDRLVPADTLAYYVERAANVSASNNLNYIKMETIPLEDCEDPELQKLR